MEGIDIPTILVGAGIVFIFFAIIGKIILPKIGVGPEIEKMAKILLFIIGVFLLASGLILSNPFTPANCLDETLHGECSTTKPKYCDNGVLIDKCSQCGCPIHHKCLPNGSCEFIPIDISTTFIPSGWMGDYGDMDFKTHTNNCHSDPTCIKITYSAKGSQGEGWAGIYWQYPENNWGNINNSYDLTGATRLTFWARGEKGNEVIEFKVGGIAGNYPDSIQPPVSTGDVKLKKTWIQYTIDLSGKELSHVIGGFCWVSNKDKCPEGCIFYLDDIVIS